MMFLPKTSHTVEFMLSPPPPLTLFSAKKGGGDLERHLDLQPISAKKGGGDLARHIFFGSFYMKTPLCQGGGDLAGPIPNSG